MKPDLSNTADRSASIADFIRDAIIEGRLIVDERLPSEAEMAEQFDVSRATIREALKRLAAQSLIRTQRGIYGGAFINRLTFEEAYDHQVTTATLLLSMNEVSFDVACEARYALERACAALAAQRRGNDHLARMEAEIVKQSDPALTDEAFCASDVAFHRALVDAADNPVLSYQLAGAVEGMQPLMNMITFTARSRERIVQIHGHILRALKEKKAHIVDNQLDELCRYTVSLGHDVVAARAGKSTSKEA